MSQKTRQEVLAPLRRHYVRAGRNYKAQLLDQTVELFGDHRKAAVRALRAHPPPSRAPCARGRPKDYDPEKLLPPLKAIWLAALQPCGVRLKTALPDWLPAYEEDHRRLNAEVREALLAASRATLDRLLLPARVEHRRRATPPARQSPARRDSPPHRMARAGSGLSGGGPRRLVRRQPR